MQDSIKLIKDSIKNNWNWNLHAMFWVFKTFLVNICESWIMRQREFSNGNRFKHKAETHLQEVEELDIKSCPAHTCSSKPHWGRVTPYGVGKFNTVSDSRSGFLMSRASFQVPTCLYFDQWLLKWLVMQTAAASSAAAVCITRCFSNRWPRFPQIHQASMS